MTDVVERIRQYRQAQGWTITELAARADVDANRLACMEDGSVAPTQSECAALELALPGL
jgi:ribosome-binding protein aMBF1 (putative translation factor)